MHLTLFVHDCFLEIGHSNAMIETLRNIPAAKIQQLHIVAYSCGDLDILFPHLKGKIFFHKVPLARLHPFILKMLFYHIWSFLYSIAHRHTIKIGIGIASLWIDVVNVQFIHTQWKDYYFKLSKLSPFAYIYKRILFLYFTVCEQFLYSRPNLSISSLSQYITCYLKGHFKISPQQISTIYSSVNHNKFTLYQESREQQYIKLLSKYPQMKNIDWRRPISLFVGAYERKGLPFALDQLKNLESAQLIVIGKHEGHHAFTFPSNIKICEISFTQELPLFYSLVDAFIFPTHYEPFGLVILEAAVCGLELYITRHHVGASELLKDIEGIHLFDHPHDLLIKDIPLLSLETKNSRRMQRLEILSATSWEKAGTQFYQMLAEKRIKHGVQ